MVHHSWRPRHHPAKYANDVESDKHRIMVGVDALWKRHHIV